MAHIKAPNEYRLGELMLMDGQIVACADVRISPYTHALHYGTACFEGLRAYWDSASNQLYLIQPEAHFARLLRSGSSLGFDLNQSVEQLVSSTKLLLRAVHAREDAYVRPLLMNATEAISLGAEVADVRLAILAVPAGERATGQLSCTVSPWRHWSTESLPVGAKLTGPYVTAFLARREARARGFDDALFLSADGKVLELTSANVFARIGKCLATPPVADGVLDGVTRRSLMSLAVERLALRVEETSLDLDTLRHADELLACGTSVGIRSVSRVDDHWFTGGETADALRQTHLDAVTGVLPAYRHWALPVY